MLRQHLINVGYPSPEPLANVERLLSLSKDDLAAMSRDELAEAAYEISAAAFVVADEYNRQKAKAERCLTEIAKRVGRRLNPAIYNRDDKWMDAAAGTDETWSLWLIRRNAITTSDRLDGQAGRLADVARSINAILYNRG